MRMAVGYRLEQCVAAIERGQDDAIRLLEGGAPPGLEWLRAQHEVRVDRA